MPLNFEDIFEVEESPKINILVAGKKCVVKTMKFVISPVLILISDAIYI